MNKNEAGKRVFEEVLEVVNSGLILKELTKRDGSFRLTCPKNAHHLTKYVHRYILFLSNYSPSIPTTNIYNVQNFADEVLDQKGKRISEGKFVFYLIDEASKSFYHLLNKVAEEYCVKFGLNPNGCLRSWKYALGY